MTLPEPIQKAIDGAPAVDRDALRECLLAAYAASCRLSSLLRNWPNEAEEEDRDLLDIYEDAAKEAVGICLTILSEELPEMLDVDMVNRGGDDYGDAYRTWQRKQHA